MPLLNKQPFTPKLPPADIRPNDEIFHLPTTNEFFKTYDEFFERTIQLNSMVWTCAVSGRNGLTFEEALESEKKSKSKKKVKRPRQNKDEERKKAKADKVKQKKDEKMRKAIEKQQDELHIYFDQALRVNVDDIDRWQQTQRLLTQDEIVQLKTAIKDCRDREKERNKDRKRREREQLIEWRKPRDDLQCDNLKVFDVLIQLFEQFQPLPIWQAVKLPDWLSSDDWARVMTILEFFWSFADILKIKDYHRSGRVSLDDLLKAIRCRHPEQSPLTDLFNILFRAKAECADEEDGDEADLNNKEEIPIELGDLDHRAYGKEFRDATRLHEQLRNTHGVSLRHLPIEAFTITEVLRLHLITAGYYTGPSTTKLRNTNRGGFRCWDDNGVQFRHIHTDVFEKLHKVSIYDMEPNERLLLLQFMCDQVLSYGKFRQSHEEKIQKLIELKKDLKNFRAWDQQQEKISRDARSENTIDEKSNEGEEGDDEEIEKENKVQIDSKPIERPKPSKETIQLKRLLIDDSTLTVAMRRNNSETVNELLLKDVAYYELDCDEIDEIRQAQRDRFQLEENRRLKQIYDLQSRCGLICLGRDRAYRSYFFSESLPGILIEEATHIDEFDSCEKPTPLDKTTLAITDDDDDDRPLIDERKRVEDLRHRLLACTGDVNTCHVHNELIQEQRSRWCRIMSADQLIALIDACNNRGYRESDLLETITYYRLQLISLVERSLDIDTIINVDTLTMDCVDWTKELCDMLLDLEQKIYDGGMGRLNVDNREDWRTALSTTGDITCFVKSLTIRDMNVFDNADEMMTLSSVTKLAIAFLQIAQSIYVRFLQLPFAEIQKTNAGMINKPTESFARWQTSLLECPSLSAIALFHATLEPNIMWNKSRLQVSFICDNKYKIFKARCRICRKKGNPDTLVRCVGCDRFCHLSCARPPLKHLPDEQWNCADCKIQLATKQRKNANTNVALRNGYDYGVNDGDSSDIYDDEHSESASEFVPECVECGGETRGAIGRHVQCSVCDRTMHRECAKLDHRTRSRLSDYRCSGCASNKSTSPPSDDDSIDDDQPYATTLSGRLVKKVRYDTSQYVVDRLQPPKRRQSKRIVSSTTSIASTSSSRCNGHHDLNGSAAELNDDGRKRRRKDEIVSTNGHDINLHLDMNEKLVKQCELIIQKAMHHTDAMEFLHPVPDYYDIIKQPMDLKTLMHNLKTRQYSHLDQLIADVRLIFDNCHLYNCDESEIYQSATRLQALMELQFEQLIETSTN